jgi:hypothetical protein
MSILQKVLSLFKNKDIALALSGQWIGHYGYGSKYSPTVQNRTVSFVADIIAQDNAFEGNIKEDTTGIPEVARIEGSIALRKIQFTKTYQNSYSIDEHGTRMVAKGPAYIQYSGIYDESEKKFKGMWTIETIYTLDSGRKMNHISSGSWEMKRLLSNN